MFPQGFEHIEDQLWLWLVAMLRPGAAFLAAPIFGMAAVPMQVRLVVSLAVGMAGLAAVPFQLPPDGVTSIAGVALVTGEVLAGLALGFAVQIGFSAALLAGETIGNTMGLGFAQMMNPLSGSSSPALGQFLSIIATFLFLAIGGHLTLATIIVDSYRALPVGAAMPAAASMRGLVMFGGDLFAAGLAIALPVGFALILVQIGFSAALLAGETIGNTMGLGFAQMMNPLSGSSSPALGQFLSIIATFLFLAIGGHLTLATIIVDSYRALPVGAAMPAAASMRGLVMFGGDLFAAGLAIALPVGFALILVQIVMGMLSRSAPAMNLFAVGLPATLLAGLVLMAIAAPSMGDCIIASINAGLAEARRIAAGQ